MIGDGGEALVGAFVRKSLPGNKFSPRYKIVGAAKDGESPRWKYSVQLPFKTQDVYGDDQDWGRADAPVEQPPSELEVYLSERIVTGPGVPAGVMALWLREGENPKLAISQAVGMGEALESDGTQRILWSAGAGDCVIVAARVLTTGATYMTHADRTSAASVGANVDKFRRSQDVVVCLASQLFGTGARCAAANGNVKDIIDGLRHFKMDVRSCYATGRFAVNSTTGHILGRFKNPFASVLDKSELDKEIL